MNANEANNRDYLIEGIPGTPFTKIKSEKGWMASIGMNVLTPVFETEEELQMYLINSSYDVVFNMVAMMITKWSNDIKEIANLKGSETIK